MIKCSLGYNIMRCMTWSGQGGSAVLAGMYTIGVHIRPILHGFPVRYTSYEPYIQRLAGCVIELSIQGADASWIMLYKRLLLERDNCSIIFLVDKVLDLIRFEYIYQCFHTFVILISFFYNNYIYISFSCFRIRFLICKGIF